MSAGKALKNLRNKPGFEMGLEIGEEPKKYSDNYKKTKCYWETRVNNIFSLRKIDQSGWIFWFTREWAIKLTQFSKQPNILGCFRDGLVRYHSSLLTKGNECECSDVAMLIFLTYRERWELTSFCISHLKKACSWHAHYTLKCIKHIITEYLFH